MSELLGFCLKLEAMHKPCLLGRTCPKCGGKGRWRTGVGFEHEKICTLHDEFVYWEPGEEVPSEEPDLFFVQTILPNWLEEQPCEYRGDTSRVQMLREMRIVRWDETTPGSPGWDVLPLRIVRHPLGVFSTQADAARELCRRAFELMTVECHGKDGKILSWRAKPHSTDCICSGHGWLPAWTKRCGTCSGEGVTRNNYLDGFSVSSCSTCLGQRWVKVPERSAGP